MVTAKRHTRKAQDSEMRPFCGHDVLFRERMGHSGMVRAWQKATDMDFGMNRDFGWIVDFDKHGLG